MAKVNIDFIDALIAQRQAETEQMIEVFRTDYMRWVSENPAIDPSIAQSEIRVMLDNAGFQSISEAVVNDDFDTITDEIGRQIGRENLFTDEDLVTLTGSKTATVLEF